MKSKVHMLVFPTRHIANNYWQELIPLTHYSYKKQGNDISRVTTGGTTYILLLAIERDKMQGWCPQQVTVYPWNYTEQEQKNINEIQIRAQLYAG